MSNILKLTRRRSLLFGLGSLAAISAVATSRGFSHHQQIQTLDDPERDFTVSQELSLKQRAAKKGLIYGTASTKKYLASDPAYIAAIVENCSMFVPEWEFKWTAGDAMLRPGFDQFDFTDADWIANFAATHKLLLRGHTLVWHESLPKWFKETVNNKNAQQLLQNHIQTVVKRYTGKIHSWDVVNEAIEPKDGRDDGLRITPWLNSLGTNYIDLAFRLTAEYDPKALLVYNEFGLDYDTPEADAKRTAVLNLLTGLKARGTPIHAFGTQAHLSPGSNRKFNPEKLRQFLRDVASLGLKIMITELDVTDKNLPIDIKVRDRIVAAAYEDYLSAALDEKAVIGVITWGLSDKYTWLGEFQPRPDRKPVRTLPLDAQMQRKLVWNAIARAFDNCPKR
ncbi:MULTISPECIES: endo-1,4-beta-xylanase [unclassified Anabaena]|uniref:endo-1,4-beta-xylanase n=1 Tax=unclassified Anabaena TaxID=2619674 RepID=UPI001444ED14|nr:MULTISPECIES: endo-1,4-beta-xylanase [unclassified Anabaena]MTJ08753.1 endo-1,4-beta-xylanase [Anabaena sp. UHCC 0204]MTJ53064.1 endo-1,4-beta-xylanase [Anabaena sp. UHCC 0253]